VAKRFVSAVGGYLVVGVVVIDGPTVIGVDALLLALFSVAVPAKAARRTASARLHAIGLTSGGVRLIRSTAIASVSAGALLIGD